MCRHACEVLPLKIKIKNLINAGNTIHRPFSLLWTLKPQSSKQILFFPNDFGDSLSLCLCDEAQVFVSPSCLGKPSLYLESHKDAKMLMCHR